MNRRAFDSDVPGAILEFAALFKREDEARRNDWIRRNVKKPTVPLPWHGPALSKGHLLAVLEGGRDRGRVRRQLDGALISLESHHLLAPYHRDDNLLTAYREITPLGEELLAENAYIEFLGGPTKVVERWRGSVVKVVGANEEGIGTGFLVAVDKVVTARHVVEQLFEEKGGLRLEIEYKVPLAWREIRVPKDSDLDLALIILTEAQAAPGFRVASHLDLLDEVVVFGFPPVPQTDDAYLVVNRGEISALVSLRHKKYRAAIVSCLLRGGHSGGPVVNRRGQVVGVVSENLFNSVLGAKHHQANEGLGFAAMVEAYWIQDLLSGALPSVAMSGAISPPA